MEKKIDWGKRFVTEKAQLFRCPICHDSMTASNSGLLCQNGHRFDVSKKGTLFFLTHQVKTEYDHDMFAARGRMIQSGMYQPLMKQLADWLGTEGTVLDVGCGEGSFLNALLEEIPQQVAIGFDISKAGVYLATQQPQPAFWCVADLTNLPFTDGQLDCVLNIFSPSNYREFARVLKPGGQLLKVVPGPRYLQELRQAFYPDDVSKQQYSNEPVLKKFTDSYPQYEAKEITYEFAIPEARQLDLLEMSPLEWGVSQERKRQVKEQPLRKITVDLLVLRGENSAFL